MRSNCVKIFNLQREKTRHLCVNFITHMKFNTLFTKSTYTFAITDCFMATILISKQTKPVICRSDKVDTDKYLSQHPNYVSNHKTLRKG